MICSFPFASAIKPAFAILGAVKVLFVRVSVDVLATSVSAPEGIVTVPPLVIDAIVGVVKVLLVRVSVVALPTTVSVAFGKVRPCNAEPLPSLLYSSTKLSLILSPPVLRSSPVPSLAEEPRPSA